MEQRPLRLGDVLDDYCPRERRVTNHAIVAMLEATVKQTRCTTCDAEHPYKGGKAPRRRTKTGDAAEAVVAPVLAPPAPRDEPTETADAGSGAPSEPATAEPAIAVTPADAAMPLEPSDPEPALAPAEEGPVHRRLIRATLPRPEGQKEARQMPEFTVRQPTGRNSNSNGNVRDNGTFRDNTANPRGNPGRRPDGNRPQRFGARPGQPGRGGQPRGQNAGFRSAQPQQGRSSGGGRKRSR